MADRSGKAMVFYNSAITRGLFDGHSYNNARGASKSCPSDYIDEQIIHDNYIWSNGKNGTGNMDDWYSQEPMTCNGLDNVRVKNRDYFTDIGSSPGVFCGTLANGPLSCTKGQGYGATNQSCTDITNMVGKTPASPISGTLYKCTAPNTRTAYYTPYTYPHPWRTSGVLADGESTAPAAPTGLSVN